MADQVEVQQRVADNIRVWARIRKVTLKSIQAELGMKKGPFFERLRGKTSMSVAELEQIAELLEVGVADLVKPPDGWAARGSNPEPADGLLVATSVATDPIVPTHGHPRQPASQSAAA